MPLVLLSKYVAMPPRRRNLARRLLPILLIATVACERNVPRQLGDGPAIGPPGVPVYAIEFDDQGALWRPEQLGRTLQAIRDFGHQHVIVVTFIHGWKHNASPNDDNLLAFEAQLQRRAELERYWAASLNLPPRPLLGVYVGWRGASWTLDPWGITQNLTFWSRKAAAFRVASPPLTDAIFSIARVTKEENPESQVVMIGHSFGGAILEKAMAQALVALVNQPNGTDFRPPVDLAVMVNPASSALDTALLVDTFMRRELYATRTTGHTRLVSPDSIGVPLLVSITARNDWATGWAFPIGQTPLSITKAFTHLIADGPGERFLYRHTGGHTSFLFNVQLTETSDPNAPYSFSAGPNKRYRLTRKWGSWNKSPYWVLDAPADVIDGHNGIFNDVFGDLLETILDAGLLSPREGAVATHVQANPGQRDTGPVAGAP